MIIVVLPAFNEAEALPSLLTRLDKVSVGHYNSSISTIVVDDGSKDGTSQVVQNMPNMNVSLVAHEQNRGLSEAIKTGLITALNRASDEDIIITMDSDDTHTPGLISRMVMMIEEGNDVVIASRYQKGARVVGLPKYRELLSIGMSLLFRAVYPIRGVLDYSCGYRAYRASLLRHAFNIWGDEFINERGFTCMVDILIKLDKLGGIMTEAPMILRYDRKPGKSKMNIRATVKRTLQLLVRHRIAKWRDSLAGLDKPKSSLSVSSLQS